MLKKNLKHLFSKSVAVVLTAALAFTSLTGIGSAIAKAAEGDIVQDLASFDNVSADKIAEVMSPGWNLGNQLEATKGIKQSDGTWLRLPDETAYGNPVVTAGTFRAVKKAGFKSVRIPVSYLDYIGDKDSGYKIDETWMDRVKEVVDMALAEGLYVTINMHGDGYNTIQNAWLLCNADASKQPEIKEKYGAVWTQIAAAFKDYDEHLLFAAMNEEFDGNYDDPVAEYYENINDYNQIFVDSVRKAGGNNDSRWLVVQGWNTDITYTCDDFGFRLPTDTNKNTAISDSRIMVEVHYYLPQGFTLGGGIVTEWGSFDVDTTKTAPDDEASMAARFNKLRDTFTSKGIPVMIGEYGTSRQTAADPNNTKYRVYFAQKFSENAKRTGAIPVVWDNHGNVASSNEDQFALFDRTTASDTTDATELYPEIIAAITGVYAEETKTDTTTKISFANSEESLEQDGTLQLNATLTPSDAKETIKWSSSDETVAVVNQEGLVKALGTGETDIIAALPNGEIATCKVAVKGVDNGIPCKWYFFESAHWSSAGSDTVYIQDGVANKYTSTITVSKEMLTNIASIYLKDVDVVNGVNSKTDIKYCHITVNSFKVNGVSIPLVRNVDINALTDQSVLDMLIINQWNIENEMIENMPTVGGPADSRTFEGYPGVTLQDTNTVEIEFETLGEGSSVTPPTTPAVKTATVKNVIYKITNSSKKTAAVTGVSKKSLTSATVASTVKIGGKSYKVTAINANAFKGCKKLASVTIGTNVTTIGKNAFNGCAKLKKITVKSTKLSSVKAGALKGIHAKCKIIVPKAKYTKYSKLFKGKGQKSTVTIVKK